MPDQDGLPPPLKRGEHVVVMATGLRGTIYIDEDFEGCAVVRFERSNGIGGYAKAYNWSQLKREPEP